MARQLAAAAAERARQVAAAAREVESLSALPDPSRRAFDAARETLADLQDGLD